jgi:NADP-dependent 3-hydroxy acid dehydrogenase YdfG
MYSASSLSSRLVTLSLTNHQDKLSALQQKLKASSNASSKIIYRTADVGEYEAIDAAVESAVEELGKIDILINNVCSLVTADTNESKPQANTTLKTSRPASPLTLQPPSTPCQSIPSRQ